jgi:MGT family glycosyltransferase
MIPDLIEVIDGWKPSLIVSGRAELAGPTVGELLGVPYATASAGRVIGLKEFINSTRQGRDELRGMLGLEADPLGSSLYRHLYLNYIPEMFLPKEDLSLPVRHNLQPPSFEDPVGGAPDWLLRLGPRSVIYVTLGSILGEFWSNVFQIAVDAVSELGHTVIVTVGHGVDTSAVASRFHGVHVAAYIPQRFILERTALVICHGGINTVLGALSHGVPLLVLPTEQSDQRWNAEVCKRLGIGLSIDIEAADRASIREAASTVLTEHSYQHSAQACMTEMLQLPSMERSVELLMRLATDREAG